MLEMVANRQREVPHAVAEAAEIFQILRPEDAAKLLLLVLPETAAEMLWMGCTIPEHIAQTLKRMHFRDPTHTGRYNVFPNAVIN